MSATGLPASTGGRHRLLHALGSTRLALFALAAIGAGVIAHSSTDGGIPGLLAGLFALGAVNLLAALLVQPRLRADLPLFLFHVALLVLLVLAAVGRLTSLTGTVELARGQVFDGQLLTREAGPLHRDGLAQLRFVNDGFVVEYAERWRRGTTTNWVRVFGRGGEVTTLAIGDIEPLVLDGYRFYTTPNKGFAPVFRWVPRAGGPQQRGAVHLPSYPMNDHRQAQTWRIPGTGRDAWVMLELERPAIDPTRISTFRVPESQRIVLVVDGVRRELEPRESVTLDDGILVYEGLTAWMGYKVFHDPTLPWLVVAALLAIASLAVFCWRRFGGAAPTRGS